MLEQAKTSKDEIWRGVIDAEIRALPSVFRAADPDFIVIRPFGEYRLGQPPPTRAAVAQLATGVVIISNTLALDAFGRFYAGEPAKGEVGLYRIGKGLQAKVTVRDK